MNKNVDNENIVLKLEKVYKIYKLGSIETHALKDINLEIKQGEIIVILRTIWLTVKLLF